MSVRARKAASASPAPSSGNERAEVEAMARRLEDLRRAADNSELRAAYQAAIEGVDAVVYRLVMLRRLEPQKAAARLPAPMASASKVTTPTRAAAARIGAVRKPRR